MRFRMRIGRCPHNCQISWLQLICVVENIQDMKKYHKWIHILWTWPLLSMQSSWVNWICQYRELMPSWQTLLHLMKSFSQHFIMHYLNYPRFCLSCFNWFRGLLVRMSQVGQWEDCSCLWFPFASIIILICRSISSMIFIKLQINLANLYANDGYNILIII